MKKMNKTRKSAPTNEELKTNIRALFLRVHKLENKVYRSEIDIDLLEEKVYTRQITIDRLKNIFSQKNVATASLVILTITCLYETLKPFF